MEDMNIFEAEPQGQAQTQPQTPQTEAVDYDLFVKETFGFDSVEAAKEHIKKTEPAFENEVS